MKYTKGSVFPYTEEQLRRDNPNTSFPRNALLNENVRADYGVEEVAETPIPIKKGYNSVQGEVSVVDGKKVETWNLVLKDVGEVTSDDIIDVRPNPPEAHSSVEVTPEFIDGEWKRTWVYEQLFGVEARRTVYGPLIDQIEFITENGLEAWQAKVAEIKAKYPK